MGQQRRRSAWTRPSQIGCPPSAAAVAEKLRSVAAGATHTLALTANGEVLAWGSNNRGQLGKDEPGYASSPSKVKLPERVKAVAAGMHFSIALGESAATSTRGAGTAAVSLASDDTEDRRRAMRVPGLPDALSIAAGETHAVALTSVGLFGWGSNATGQIGVRAQQLRPAPFLSLSRSDHGNRMNTMPITPAEIFCGSAGPSPPASRCRRRFTVAATAPDLQSTLPSETFVEPRALASVDGGLDVTLTSRT